MNHTHTILRPRKPIANAFVAALVVFGLDSSSVALAADAPITLELRPMYPEANVSPAFTGLSYEVASILPDNGPRYFRADNAPLIALFHTLGIKSLRIGGNTSDR